MFSPRLEIGELPEKYFVPDGPSDSLTRFRSRGPDGTDLSINVKKIKLTQGKYALVDDEDFDRLSRFKWCAAKSGYFFYAMRKAKMTDGCWRTIKMHREILGSPDGILVDHRNRDSLDNRKCNLRLCTINENNRNRTNLQKNNTTGYRGVTFDRRKKRFRAQIVINKKHFWLGTYKLAKDAASRYQEIAQVQFGQFYNANFTKLRNLKKGK